MNIRPMRLALVAFAVTACANDDEPTTPTVDEATSPSYALPAESGIDRHARLSSAALWEAQRRHGEQPDFEHADEAPWDRLPVQAPLRERRRAVDPCGARCGDDRFCRGMCLLGDPPLARRGDIECLACGRETGFNGRPDLRISSRQPDSVILEWDAVEGAASYVVHSVRWVADHTVGVRGDEYATRETALHIDLDPSYIYMFYVVGWDAEHKEHTAPSNPVLVEPTE